jgi:hypothetical protein
MTGLFVNKNHVRRAVKLSDVLRVVRGKCLIKVDCTQLMHGALFYLRLEFINKEPEQDN